MLIKFAGQEYEYDPAGIDVKTAIAIRDHTGMGIRSWQKAIDDADPLALQALLWVVKDQNGERVPIRTLNFAVVEFFEAVVDAARRELVDRLVALAERGEASDDDRQALAVLSGEAPPEAMPDPTVTAAE